MNTFSLLGFQDSASNVMEQMSNFHDEAMMGILFILSFISLVLLNLFKQKSVDLMLLCEEKVEFSWTLVPGIFLVGLALPSLKVVYATDDLMNTDMTVKAIGQQWYWTYEYTDYENVSYSSYMSTPEGGSFRLLEVDNHLVVPVNVKTRVMVTSTDVIHSWAVPALGVKMDANPGRINQCYIESSRMGLFYGQCSEICGSLHSFMPVCVEVGDINCLYKHLMKHN